MKFKDHPFVCAIVIILVIMLLYRWTRPAESFGGVNPNDVVRIMQAINRYPGGPPALRNTNYALFSAAIIPTQIHEWTFQELQNISVNGMLNVPNVRFLLTLDAKYATHPAFMANRAGQPSLDYPQTNPPPKTSQFVINVGTNRSPKWIVSS